jgi:ABC-type nitrate/sulfonate/bicarbonate transport system substrate-binding protein
MEMKFKTTLILILIGVFSFTACTPLISEPPTSNSRPSITFMAGYKPQANLPFVGVYVAQEKGFFDQEELDVTIEHSPGRGEHLQLLTAGKVHVTTQDAAVLLKRRADPGLPLVSIALLGQRGQQAFAALKSSGLSSPKNWEGHTVGYKGTPPPDLFAIMAAAGVDSEKVELVNVGFDPRVLTEGQVDVYPVYKSNEPYLISNWGYEITLWDAADFGAPTLGLTYVTSEEILSQEEEALTRFLRAALKGVQYAADNPDEAVDIVLQYTGPETDREHMGYMLDAELVDATSEATDQVGLGWQTLQQWADLADLLVAYEAMPPTDPAEAYTNQLLEAVYNDR